MCTWPPGSDRAAPAGPAAASPGRRSRWRGSRRRHRPAPSNLRSVRRAVRPASCRPPGSRSRSCCRTPGSGRCSPPRSPRTARSSSSTGAARPGRLTGTVSVRETFSLSREAAPPGPVGPLDVEPAHPALADRREQVRLRQLRTQGPLDRAVREVLPAHGEDGRLDPRGPVGRPDHRAVQRERRRPGRVGDPDVPVQRERVEARSPESASRPCRRADSVHRVLAARGPLQPVEQRAPAAVRVSPNSGLPPPHFARHPEPRPVQRPVVVPAQIAAARARAPAPGPRPGPTAASPARTTTRSACAYDRAPPSARANSRCHGVESGRRRISWGTARSSRCSSTVTAGADADAGRGRRRIRGGERRCREGKGDEGDANYVQAGAYPGHGNPSVGWRKYRLRTTAVATVPLETQRPQQPWRTVRCSYRSPRAARSPSWWVMHAARSPP